MIDFSKQYKRRKMSDQIQFAPFRSYNDIIGQAENYAIPDFRDIVRLSNRITNNLLYYQTNYFMVFLAIFVIISIIHPLQFVIGLFAFLGLSGGIIFLTNKNVEIQRFKRDKPYLNLIGILLLTGFMFRLFGSMLIFLFSICLPLTCNYIYYYL